MTSSDLRIGGGPPEPKRTRPPARMRPSRAQAGPEERGLCTVAAAVLMEASRELPDAKAWSLGCAIPATPGMFRLRSPGYRVELLDDAAVALQRIARSYDPAGARLLDRLSQACRKTALAIDPNLRRRATTDVAGSHSNALPSNRILLAAAAGALEDHWQGGDGKAPPAVIRGKGQTAADYLRGLSGGEDERVRVLNRAAIFLEERAPHVDGELRIVVKLLAKLAGEAKEMTPRAPRASARAGEAR